MEYTFWPAIRFDSSFLLVIGFGDGCVLASYLTVLGWHSCVDFCSFSDTIVSPIYCGNFRTHQPVKLHHFLPFCGETSPPIYCANLRIFWLFPAQTCAPDTLGLGGTMFPLFVRFRPFSGNKFPLFSWWSAGLFCGEWRFALDPYWQRCQYDFSSLFPRMGCSLESTPVRLFIKSAKQIIH